MKTLFHPKRSLLAVGISAALATSLPLLISACKGPVLNPSPVPSTTSALPLAETAKPEASIQTVPPQAEPVTPPGKPSEEATLDAYANSGYTYCDAKLLATHWGMGGTRDSKIRVGELLLRNEQPNLEEALSQARRQAKQQVQKTNTPACQYDSDGGYTYDDAVLLASYWGKPSPWEAKLKIGRLLVEGQTANIQTALQRAKQTATTKSPSPQTPPGKPSEEAILGAYANSDYTYCDAKLLATHWKISNVYDSKLRIGEQLLRNRQSNLKKALSQARHQAKRQMRKTNTPACQYDTEGGYTYDDAVLLARYWGKPSPWEAKLKIGRLLVEGQIPSIQTALQRAKQAETTP